MPRTLPPQTDAGRLIQARREQLGLSRREFCELVARQRTNCAWGSTTLSESHLSRIENLGTVPCPGKRLAIAKALGFRTASDVWQIPHARLVDQLTERMVAA